MLLAGPLSHMGTQYIDFVDFLHFTGFVYHLFYSFLVGVELSLCTVVILSRMWCHVFWSQVEYIGSFVLLSETKRKCFRNCSC